MSLKDELLDEFSVLGITPADNVINKCLEACIAHNVNAEEFVETWSAYSVSKLNGAPPNMETITTMIRKELEKPEAKKSAKKLENFLNESLTIVEDVAVASPMQTPKRNKENVPFNGTPKRLMDEDLSSSLNSPKSAFSPVTYRSTKTDEPTQIAFVDRKDALEVVSSFGNKSLQDRAKFFGKNSGNVSVELSGRKLLWAQPDARCMYEKPLARHEVIQQHTHSLGAFLLEKHGFEKADPFRDRLKSQIVTYGKIRCDAKGRLNSDSVMLESTPVLSSSEPIYLDLSKVSDYTIFPGQVVIVQAVNTFGSSLVVDKLITDARLPLPQSLPTFALESTPLQVVAATGPFTLMYNLEYEPLQELLKYVNDKKPDVLILLGPFVDYEHPSCNTVAETYESFFESLIEQIVTTLANVNTQIVMVSSQKDAFHVPVYPTPPFSGFTKSHKNLHFVPDPCIFNINGVSIGVTTTDILFDISKEQVSCGNTLDRMGRFVAKIIEQQSFYPLYPPSKDLSLDQLMFYTHGMFNLTPHILILPSAFKCFIKNVHDCIVVNPERLSKGNVGGTFTRMEIHPTKTNSLVDSTVVQIVKI